MNETDFVSGLRRRDPAAVRHLTECYLPSVWRFVYVQVRGDHHVAEDIVSEAVLALVRAATAGTDISSPGAWLRTVAQHKVQDHYRAAARVQHLMEQVKQTGPVVDASDAHSQQEQLERRMQIRSVMDALPEQQRQVLEWKYIDKLSVRDMAELLGATEKAVESMLFRARRDFRERLHRSEKKIERPQGEAGICRNRDLSSLPRLEQEALEK